jgi:hypothetical protein
MQALLTEATEKSVKAVATLGINYVKGAIMGVLVPMLTDALKGALEDAKEEVKGDEGKEAPEVAGPRGRKVLHERLARDEKEAGIDTNILHLETCPTQWVWFGPAWTGYQMYTIKFGTDKKTNMFYAIGYDVVLRHSNMRQLDKGLREEFKENKAALDSLPVLPPDCLHGTKCGCMVRTVDPYAQYGLFKPYMAALKQKPFTQSKYAQQMFRIGDDWEAQALLKAVFDQAVIDTMEDTLGRPASRWYDFKDPFDEAEAVRQLLYVVAERDILPRLRGMINPPVCAYNARLAAESALLGNLDIAAQGWAAGMDKLNGLKAEAIKAVQDAGDTLVEKLKPHLIKVLEKVNAKMKKKEEKKEEKKEDKSVKMGDVTFSWHFSATTIGRKLNTALLAGPAKKALSDCESDLNPRTVLERELKSVAEAIGGEGITDAPGIGSAIRELSSKMNDQIYRFNTLGPLIAAVQDVAAIRDEMQTALQSAAGDAAKVEAQIAAQSLAMWDRGLAGSILKMFSDYTRIRGTVKSAYGGDTPEKAATAMIEFVDYLFQGHVRALNSLRIRYIELLRTNLTGAAIEAADTIAEHSRRCFAQAFFEIADVLVDDFWVKLCDNIVLFACATAFATFKREVWEEMKELLEPIKSVLPDPVAKANVHETIILKLIEMVINKAMTWITTKMLIWAEKKIFDQSEAASS